MSGRTIERHQSIEYALAEEEKALLEIQQIRERQEKEQDRVLRFEESGGTRIISYNETLKEIVWRDPEGHENVDIQPISPDEKNQLDAIYEIISEYEAMEPDVVPDIEEDKEIEEDFFTDEFEDNDRDEMEF